MYSDYLSIKSQNSKRMSFEEITCVLLLIGSSFYLNKYSSIAIVLITIPLVLELFLFVIKKRTIPFSSSIFAALLVFFATFLFQLLILQNEECLAFMFSIAYFIMAMFAFKNASLGKINKMVRLFLLFASVILLIDTIYRFSNPLVTDYATGINSFYKYKGEGFIFNDTNNTGMLALSILCFIHYFENKFKRRMRIFKLVFFIFLLLTFCRAAIVVYLLFYVLTNKRVPKWIKMFSVAIIAVGLVAFSGLIITYIEEDISFMSKINLAKRMFNSYSSSGLLNIVIGIGFTKSIIHFGMFTHAWPLTFLFEFGLVGFFLIIFLWIKIFTESNKKAAYLLVPFLVAGISFYPLLSPYFYTLCALICCLEKKRVIKYE